LEGIEKLRGDFGRDLNLQLSLGKCFWASAKVESSAEIYIQVL
jgi:hypothetical protein